MEYYRKIAKGIQIHHLMAAIVTAVVISALIFVFIICTGNYSQWVMGLLASAIALVICVLVGFFSASLACGRIHHRIHSCDGAVSLESETFTPCAKELSYGSEWLVYHKENTYLFWTKKNIHQIKLVSQKRNRCVLAIYSTLHPEGEAVKCSYDEASMDSLRQWLSSTGM
jgi:hypothetical protein